MGMLAWLEAAGGGYPDRNVRRRSDNHAHILSEARGPEEAKAAWASEPALMLRPLPVAKAQQRCASGTVEIARWLQRCSRAATIGQLNSKPGRKTHARAVLESQATSQCGDPEAVVRLSLKALLVGAALLVVTVPVAQAQSDAEAIAQPGEEAPVRYL
jgi:hypothetical protein